MAADRGFERDVAHRTNEGYRALGALKCVLSNRGLGINAKKYFYEGVIVPTSLYGAKAWGMRSVNRRKVKLVHPSLRRRHNKSNKMHGFLQSSRCLNLVLTVTQGENKSI